MTELRNTGPAGLVGQKVWHPLDLPEGYHADPRAELHEAGYRLHRGLPPGWRAVGLRQVDGMPREPRCGLAEQTRSEPLASARHAPGRTSTNPQANWYAPTPDVSRREAASTFGTKRSSLAISYTHKQHMHEDQTVVAWSLPLTIRAS